MKQTELSMKYNFFQFKMVAVLMVTVSMLQAQSAQLKERVHLPVQKAGSVKMAPMVQQFTGLEDFNPNVPSVPGAAPVFFRNLVDEIAGTTAYDNQSNGTEQSRLYVWPNGEISATWTMSQQEETTTAPSSWTDRGTGYNTRTKWAVGNTPTTRLESVRTGFTNYVVTSDGTEITFAHRVTTTTPSIYYIRMSRKAAGTTTWVESDIPSTAPSGSLWCKAAVDGNNVYVLSLTAPTALSGSVYKGLDGHVLFHRSKDGGASWDIVDGIIPGLDSSAYAEIGTDTYCIDAKDGVVAVGIFDSWNDAKIFKSFDNGTTWDAPITVLDFPLTKYVSDKGYTTADIGGIDPNGPSSTDSLEIFTSDKNASILIDNGGFVHAWVGRMWVTDIDLTDNNSSFYPGVNGLMYWNELDAENLYLIAGCPDINNNDTLDIEGSINDVTYGSNISSMPTSAVSVNDTMYVAYSAMIEGLNDENGLPLRHVLLIKSGDFGQTWESMYDVHYLGSDPGLGDFQEGARPYFSKRMAADGILHLLYMRDYSAGTFVSSTIGGAAANIPGQADMVYMANPTTSATKNPVVKVDLNLTPNPATDRVRIAYNIAYNGSAQVEIYNTLGVRVYAQNTNVQNGENVVNVNTTNYANGLYYARIQAGKYIGVEKFTVSK